MELKISKEKITGLIGATIFMFLLLLLLLFSYFTLAHPNQDLGGIPVMFGSVDDAAGYNEPPRQELMPSTEEVKPTIAEPSEPPLISQITEQSIAIREQKNREEKERREQQQRQAQLAEQQKREEEALRKKREEEAKRQSINKELSGLFGENASANRGNTEGSGTQGVSTGNSSQGSPTGVGGVGASHNLGGRGVGGGGLVLPKYTVDDAGRIVIDIIVDSSGKVIDAAVGRGTTTTNATLIRETLVAARNTKFLPITTAENQKGTITYSFRLN